MKLQPLITDVRSIQGSVQPVMTCCLRSHLWLGYNGDMVQMTTYEEAVAYLNSFINYEKKRSDQFSAEVMDVDRPVRLLAALGDPHKAYPTIHIAGTKGKGSTAAFCAAALQASGYRVGLYTSPHLLDIRERFRVLGEAEAGWVSKRDFVALVNEVQEPVANERGLTWYEIFTAVAFLHFARQHVDIAVIEVGLGGRLDATNVVMPLVSVITSISMDHMSLLGNTLTAIAGEKGGIIKPAVPVVIAPQAAEAQAVLLEIAAAKQAEVCQIGRDWSGMSRVPAGGGHILELEQMPEDATWQVGDQLELGLLGAHQAENALNALATLSLVRPTLPALTAESIRAGLKQVTWPGRLQQLATVKPESPIVIADGAHNGDSAAKLLAALRRHFAYDTLYIVMGSGIDKDYEAILRQFVSGSDCLILTAAPHPRAAPPELLAEVSETLAETLLPPHSALCSASFPDLHAALQYLVDVAKPSDLICVTGTLFLVAELLKEWDNWQIF